MKNISMRWRDAVWVYETILKTHTHTDYLVVLKEGKWEEERENVVGREGEV